MNDADLLRALEQALDRVGEAWLPAHGQSMGRHYRGVQALLVRREAGVSPRVGEVAVMRSGADRWVAHRVLARYRRRGGARFVTKGDGRIEADWPSRGPEDYVGRVVALRTAGGERRIDRPLSRWAGRLRAAFGLGAALAWEGMRWMRGRRREGH